MGKDEIFGEESTTSPVVKDPSEDKKLGPPHIMVTPAAEAEAGPKPRRPANLVTSWGPNVMKLKEKSKQGSGGVKTRTSPRTAPQLPPKSTNAIKQQQSGKIN